MVEEEVRKADPIVTKTESVEKVKEYGALTLLGEN